MQVTTEDGNTIISFHNTTITLEGVEMTAAEVLARTGDAATTIAISDDMDPMDDVTYTIDSTG